MKYLKRFKSVCEDIKGRFVYTRNLKEVGYNKKKIKLLCKTLIRIT